MVLYSLIISVFLPSLGGLVDLCLHVGEDLGINVLVLLFGDALGPADAVSGLDAEQVVELCALFQGGAALQFEVELTSLDQLEQLRQRIEMGESFEDLAKRHSEDASAPQGGDLGWLSPGETVPAFEQAMNALEPGQVSQPVHSPFGWHLIVVEDRRTKDMEDEYKRMQARQILFQRRAEPAFEDWLNRLHGEAYIDNRLDPESNRNNRRVR